MTFINSAIVIQLVYVDIPVLDIPFVLAKYEKFSQEWYTEVGITIVITLMLMIFAPHFSNLMFQALAGCLRCCDRGCSCNKKKTKKIVQEDYE